MNKDERLFLAVQQGDVAAVKAAIENWANAKYIHTEENNIGRIQIPVLYVACSSRSDYDGTYCQSFRLRTREVGSATKGEIVKMLLANGADPNERFCGSMPAGSEWDTCLIASFPSIEIACILLENGADPNLPQGWREDGNNETLPIEAAAGNSNLINLLLRHGDKPRCRS